MPGILGYFGLSLSIKYFIYDSDLFSNPATLLAHFDSYCASKKYRRGDWTVWIDAAAISF